MRTTLLLLLVIGLSFSFLSAQQVVSMEFLEHRTEAQLSNQFPTNGVPGVERFGADLYKVTYETPDIHGVLDTASGLFIYPTTAANDREFPMLIYQHGTVGSRDDVPSELQGGYTLALFWASVGYATTAADFLGLGTARGFHPYVHARTEATVAIDMHLAVKEYAQANGGLYFNDQLFLTGYSQGGHAAAAAQKMIQEDYVGQLEVTASAPMSGPYSISGVMRDLMLGDDAYFFVGYAPYSVMSYNLEYNIFEDTDEIFKEPVATWAQQFYDEEIDLWELNDNIIGWLVGNFGASVPKHMFLDSIINVIENDLDHPINQALRDNDLINWAPAAPTRLYYCTADDQVPFMNSIIAVDSMQAAGATNVLAFDVGSGLDHGDCVNPAVISGFLFFRTYQSIGFILNARDINHDLEFQISPNPAKDQISIHFQNGLQDFEQIDILNMNGQAVKSVSNQSSISFDGLISGVYFVKVSSDDGVWIEKLIVQ